ncbi:ATP-dependent Clp protease ATP-binding subunit [Saccharothrix sp. AJ9571]|nr:ATP-dependent Clp protease ATP-binding subunit [Saccharothrix sp. AJ9571]
MTDFFPSGGGSLDQFLARCYGDAPAARPRPVEPVHLAPAPPRPLARTELPDTPTVDRFGHDLTEAARRGALDPVLGREHEIEQTIEVLSRRTKNNPVLIGEAGVGKTAIVEGLAQRIADGDVPDVLAGRRLIQLDLTALVAGTRYRGDFEERVTALLAEIRAHRDRLVLFIDELHTVAGAGSSEGSPGAGNMLKPALARGELPVVGATTLDEYREGIEGDPALERRFQPITVGEPSVSDALEILHGLRGRYEAHHGIRYTDAALVAAAELSHRYLTERFLPDKAIDLVDQAGARVRLRGDGPDSPVTPEDIAEVVSRLTGVPVGRLTEHERDRLLRLEEHLHRKVIGQDEAVTAVAGSVRRSRAGFAEPGRPSGSFLFLGPTGVGKTELARALAEALFGDAGHMVRIDMSEYGEQHAVSRLLGAPPGYVGHEDAGQLTEAVRRRPYSVVLLDEIEKAHPGIFPVLLQVLDDGRLTDTRGRTVDFSNTVVIMTSNLGSELIGGSGALGFTPASGHDPEKPLRERLVRRLRESLRPEFLNRIDEIIVFRRLTDAQLERITELMLESTRRRARARDIELDFTPGAVRWLSRAGHQPEYGARPMRRAIQRAVDNPLADLVLRGGLPAGARVRVTERDNELSFEVTAETGGRPA